MEEGSIERGLPVAGSLYRTEVILVAGYLRRHAYLSLEATRSRRGGG